MNSKHLKETYEVTWSGRKLVFSDTTFIEMVAELEGLSIDTTQCSIVRKAQPLKPLIELNRNLEN